ncbi:MAG TPA: response regulator [Candidatus Acidoferrales bacterium]|jgi:two-component system chemotaxis response regulator CheY
MDTKQSNGDKTALVVEDNAAIRQMLVSAFLSNRVFKTCAEAENGKAGIEVAKKIHPDIITLDLSMPVMNGMEAASELRKLFPKTPIILFTLYGDGISQTEAAKSGINLVLSKSTPLQSLIVIAHRLLGLPD